MKKKNTTFVVFPGSMKHPPAEGSIQPRWLLVADTMLHYSFLVLGNTFILQLTQGKEKMNFLDFHPSPPPSHGCFLKNNFLDYLLHSTLFCINFKCHSFLGFLELCHPVGYMLMLSHCLQLWAHVKFHFCISRERKCLSEHILLWYY